MAQTAQVKQPTHKTEEFDGQRSRILYFFKDVDFFLVHGS